jgi:replicative DNA helicase
MSLKKQAEEYLAKSLAGMVCDWQKGHIQAEKILFSLNVPQVDNLSLKSLLEAVLRLKKENIPIEVGSVLAIYDKKETIGQMISDSLYSWQAVDKWLIIWQQEASKERAWMDIIKLKNSPHEWQDLCDLAQKITEKRIQKNEQMWSNLDEVSAEFFSPPNDKHSTGIEIVDKHKIESGELVILAGRPGMGKTSFATSIAIKRILNNYPTIFFSMEMRDLSVMRKIVAGLTGIPTFRLKDATKLRADEKKECYEAFERAKDSGFCLASGTSLTLPMIENIVKSRVHLTQQKQLIIIDYLQLIHEEGAESETIRISNISRKLKSLALETGCPIICLSQLSRDNEKRIDKVPMLSDLRGSGSIEQDADRVWFVYREEYYAKKEFDPKDNPIQEAQLICAKVREGPQAVLGLNFNRDTQVFY